ncbi:MULTISPECIES: styrene monooxygenase/indole monooxygenase family protein [unclassified Mycobacteroides]|uniref:styrene monooxygenase/indole monooxygenase family protein n=1 Tax=unclassified Mycobacteroides TaxID=2618759 RepID=UPI001EEF8A78|nr:MULTISPECIES: styrene monooxygenase/indole monooxygenase family protein [unclassified Mycobacteroides]
MFDSALTTERELGLDHWRGACPDINAVAITVTGATPSTWSAPLSAPAQAVDQRVKCATWAEEVQERGGTLVVRSADVTYLEECARTHDLVIIATGRGDIGRLFPPDHERSPFDRPQRVLALTYITGMRPRSDDATVAFTLVPGVGELITLPALTASGPCDILVFEGVPGGPMDCWDDITDADGHLERSLELLAKFAPAEFDRCHDIALTDDGGVLRSRFTPRVRGPVATLPSGRAVLGIGDAVVLNDPVTAQGANLAAQAATYYLDAINRHNGRGFDETWMRATFEKFWRGWAQWAVEWTNSMLEPLAGHQTALLGEASVNPALAAAIADGFDDPRQFFQWWFDAEAATRIQFEKRVAHAGRFQAQDLRCALGQYATGVAVITARGADGRRVGMTVNSFTSVSMDPPLVLWCLGKNAPSLPAFVEATHFAVNLLAADQDNLCRQFSTPAANKFAQLELVEGKGGTPVLPDVLARFECRTAQCLEAGDHLVVLGEIESFEVLGGPPLVFHAGSLHGGCLDAYTHS